MVLPRQGGDAAEGGQGVEFDGAVGFVGLELGFVGCARAGRVGFVAQQGVGFDGFVMQVQRHECLAPRRPLPKVGVKRDAGEVALEVEPVFFAVGGVVEDGVDVVEDVVFGDWGLGIGDWEIGRLGDWEIGVVVAELRQRPVGDVVYPIP